MVTGEVFDRSWLVRAGVVDVFADGTVGRGAFARSLSHRQPRVEADGTRVPATMVVSDAGLEIDAGGVEFDTVRIVGRVLDRRDGQVAEVAVELVELVQTGPSLEELLERQRWRRAVSAGC
ncbi:MAG: hypothetical protein R2695_15740 [Acidimicrobiales bacterium]